jgi:hypothetical protein
MLGLPRDHETYEYAVLQLFDVLSLCLCLSDWEAVRSARPSGSRTRPVPPRAR